jgi:hypothetical protein
LVLKTLFLTVMVALFSIVIWRWTLDDPFRLRMRSWLRAMPMMRKVNACL